MSEHRWGPHGNGHSHKWSKCERCSMSKFYDWMPGWPGWTTYYTPEGEYTANNGVTDPGCISDTEYERKLIAAPEDPPTIERGTE